MPSVKRSWSIGDFQRPFGRLRMNTHATQLAPGETSSMLNIDYDVPGAKNKRKGYEKKYASSLGTGAIRGMATYDPRTGSSKDFVWWGTKAYYEDANGALQESLISLTAGDIDSIQTHNQLFFINGTDKKRFDGTSWFPWGVAVPGTAPTVAVGAVGLLSGTYYYKVVFVNSKGALSNPSTASASVAPSGQQVNLSAIPTGAAGTDVTKRYIYRTKANETATYWYVAVIPDNTTTTYTDNIADSSLGSEMDTDNDVCPAGTMCETWQARVWVAGNSTYPQKVYKTKVNRPEQFETALDIEASDGQDITGLLDFGFCLLIGKERSVYRLTGTVETPSKVTPGLPLIDIKPLRSHVGPVSNRVFRQIGSYAVFLSKHDGIWCVITASDTDGVPNVVFAGEDVKPIVDNLTSPSDAHAYVYDNKYYLYLKVTEDGSTVKYCLVCDFRLSKPLAGEFWWSVYKYADGFNCFHRRPDGYLYAGDDTNGYVYKMGKSDDAIAYSDDGDLIDAYFYVPDIDFSWIFNDAGMRQKLMRKLWVTAKRFGTDHKIRVKPFFNGTAGAVVEVTVTEAIDAMDDLIRGGDMEYDTYKVDLTEQMAVANPRFKHWGCKVQNNTVNDGMTVYKIGGTLKFMPAR